MAVAYRGLYSMAPADNPDPLQVLRQFMSGYLDRELTFSELLQLKRAFSRHAAPVAEHDNTILVLGSYDDQEKRRLDIVRRTLGELYARNGRKSTYAFLLDDIPGQGVWVNMEVKFRFFASVADHIVGVPESDVGGFMFEQGILASHRDFIGKSYFLKRDYPTTEEEHETFSLMQADSTLYKTLERRGDLYHWQTEPELVSACFELYYTKLS